MIRLKAHWHRPIGHSFDCQPLQGAAIPNVRIPDSICDHQESVSGSTFDPGYGRFVALVLIRVSWAVHKLRLQSEQHLNVWICHDTKARTNTPGQRESCDSLFTMKVSVDFHDQPITTTADWKSIRAAAWYYGELREISVV